MGGRGHLVGVKAQGKGLVLSILRYANELRDPKPYFVSPSSASARSTAGRAATLSRKAMSLDHRHRSIL